MKETLRLFKNVIRHPGQVVNQLNEKSWKLYIILLLINSCVAGWLFLYSKFSMPFSLILVLGGPLAGALLVIYVGMFQGIYFLISKFILKEQQKRGIKVISYYFIIAFTLYHLVAAVVILSLVPIYQYGLSTIFYNISHLILIFWIAALCAQGIQQLRAETDLQTMKKVFPALFGSYALQMALIFILGEIIIRVAYG